MTEAELFSTLAPASSHQALLSRWPYVEKKQIGEEYLLVTFSDGSSLYTTNRGTVATPESVARTQAEAYLWPTVWKWMQQNPIANWPVEWRDALVTAREHSAVGGAILESFLK